jgi:hypothetical protein
MDGEYERFCRESGCVKYNSIFRLESIPIHSDDIKRQLAIMKVGCEQSCERSANQFYNWLKINDLIF